MPGVMSIVSLGESELVGGKGKDEGGIISKEDSLVDIS